MDDKEREIFAIENENGNNECQCNSDEEGSRELLKRGVNVNQRNSNGETALMIACKTGNVAAVREILQRRDDDVERVDISAEDENGQTALLLAKQSNNTEIVAMIEQNLFLRAVENGDIKTVKTYLSIEESILKVLCLSTDTGVSTDHQEKYSENMEIQSHEVALTEAKQSKRFKAEIETEFTSKDSITRSIWLEAVAIAEHKCLYEMQFLLLNDDYFINGFNKDGQTILHQVVAEYLEADPFSPKKQTLEILLMSRKLNANVLNLQSKTIFEILCKIKPNPNYWYFDKIYDLLLIFLEYSIDLNGRNQNGETCLMLACENRRFDIVRSLLKLPSQEFVLDIDAVDNSGETALMKAKRNNDSKIVSALLGRKLISAVKDENVDVVKFILAEFRNTLDAFVKSWSSIQEHDEKLEQRETKFGIWLEAIHIAMENGSKHSEEILKLLLDYDIHLSQEIEADYFSFDKLMDGWEVDDDKKLRLIELFLIYGKINVNDSDEFGQTALHWAEDEKLTSLFIRYGADVNRKDKERKTPLMPISENWSIRRYPVLQTLLEEAGTLVNLDAMDCNGRTALMHAVMSHRLKDVELLLSKGASVNLSDHLGFTALHHALHGNIYHHFKFPRNSEELNTLKELDNLFDAETLERHIWRNEEWSEERRKIVEMLLQRTDIDVNVLSIEVFSPLDIAEAHIPPILSSTKDALKEKGAVLNIFRDIESQSASDFPLDFTRKFTLRQLVETEIAVTDESLNFIKEKWLALIETLKGQRISDEDQQGRTAMHLAAIFSNCLLTDNQRTCDLVNTIVDKLISIGCNVNEIDNFGRTPLHYANKVLWKSLISNGADTSIKDEDGNIAIEQKSHHFSSKTSDIVSEVKDRNDEIYLLSRMNNQQMEINVQCVDYSNGNGVPECCQKELNLKTTPRLLWTECEYASRHPLVEKITKDVRYVIEAIAKEIERLDPRFAIRPELVGSSNEGTRLDKPDEFDFCFVLVKFSELCEVSQSPEHPTGFLHLKRRPMQVDEASDLDSIFGKDGILNTVKLNWQFSTILRNALVNIDKQLGFEWILEFPFDDIFNNLKKVLNVKMIKPLNFFTPNEISVDIVPCIHVDGWWPDEAISNVGGDIKKFGCNLVFDSPQRLYPWVPYSESCARISFSKAESDMIKECCDNAKVAYMIGKTMLRYSNLSLSNYILKNCLLYCIEALSPSSEKASQLGLRLEEMKFKFLQIDRYLWLKCLLKCLLEFVAQDFCPCYFLPAFSSCSLAGKEHYLKKVSFDWISDHGSTFPKICKFACALYRWTSSDILESSYQLPAPNPLWERFDRKLLITSLCEIAYK